MKKTLTAALTTLLIATAQAATAPGAPTIGTATAGNAQASVKFTAPTNNGGSAITKYTATANPGGKTGSGTASPLTVTGLTNGTAYTFTVTATNAIGTGPASNPSNSVTPATVPGAPTIGTATAGNAQATVSFTAPTNTGGSPITKYTVTSTPGSKTGTGTASPITVTGLTNGTAYTFKVTATNAKGTGSASTASNSVTPTAATVPGAPAITSATPGNGQASITFTAPTSNGGSAITGYTVTSTPAGGTDTNANTTSLTHVVTGLSNGTAYTFTVTAKNAVGTGPASTPSASVTPATVPGTPTSPTATAGNAQATVTFTAPTSNGGSPITSYTVTSTPGNFTGTGTASPITVTGLANGTAYTFTVTATNVMGTGSASTASNSVTPILANAMTLYFIETDHLETPRRIADANDTTVWQWDNAEPFGNSASTTPAGFVYNQRFPGQYWDAETGLHYNMFRNYDPAKGGYVESDPIGLRGGLNTYSYVLNAPTMYIDPLGLAADAPGFCQFCHPPPPPVLPGNQNNNGGPMPTPDPAEASSGNYVDTAIQNAYNNYASNTRMSCKDPDDRCKWLKDNQQYFPAAAVKATAKAWGCRGSRWSGGNKF